MLRYNLIHTFTGPKLLQDQLYRNPSCPNDGLSHHDLGIGNDLYL
jgi:hypothetical protein